MPSPANLAADIGLPVVTCSSALAAKPATIARSSRVETFVAKLLGKDTPVEQERRRLLLGLAAASTAAAGLTLSVAPALALAQEAENPELLRLGEEFDRLYDEYVVLRAHKLAVLREGDRRWPVTPEALFLKDAAGGYVASSAFGPGEMERDFAGGARMRRGESEPRALVARASLRYPVEAAQQALASKHLARRGTLYGRDRASWEAQLQEHKPLFDLSEAYHQECDRLQEELGWTAAWQAVSNKKDQLSETVTALMAQKEQTVAGLLIKARAVQKFGRTDYAWFTYQAIQWGGELAEAVLRFAERGAVS